MEPGYGYGLWEEGTISWAQLSRSAFYPAFQREWDVLDYAAQTIIYLCTRVYMLSSYSIDICDTLEWSVLLAICTRCYCANSRGKIDVHIYIARRQELEVHFAPSVCDTSWIKNLLCIFLSMARWVQSGVRSDIYFTGRLGEVRNHLYFRILQVESSYASLILNWSC